MKLISSNTPGARPANGIQTQPSGAADPSLATLGASSSLCLFFFALGFRLIYVIQSSGNPLFGVAVVDAASYVEWAHKMVQFRMSVCYANYPGWYQS